MKLKILYFASLREALGTPMEELLLPAGVDSTGSLRDWLSARNGNGAEAFARTRNLRVAVDQRLCDWNTPLRDGAEVAFFPPVTGG